MAPLLISDSDINGVLKTVYAGYREKVFPISTPLLAQLERGKSGGAARMRWGGAGVNFDVVLTRPVGMTSSDSGYLADHAQATEKQATLGVKRLYVTRQIDGLSIVGTQSKEQAFVSLAKKILEEAKDAARLGMQEILHGNGTGIKAVITTVNSTTSIDVISPYGVTGAGEGGLLLDVGMVIKVLDVTNSYAVLTSASAITAVSNSGDTCTLTLGTALTGMAAGDVIVAASTNEPTATQGSYNAHPNGLINITNRGDSYESLHNISQNTYPRWDATRMVAGTDTASAAQPEEGDLWDLSMKIAGRSGKDAKSRPGEFLLMTTPGLEKKFCENVLGQRRFSPADLMNIKGGYKAFSFNGIPLISDTWCPAGTVYLLHIPSLFWVDAKDWGQVEYESSSAWRFISGRDAFETSFASYLNVGTKQRNAHGSIVSYTDTSRYSHVA